MNELSDHQQSIYFLNSSSSSSSVTQRYTSLIQQGEKWGEFLTFDQHLSWLNCYAYDAQQLESQLPLLVFRPHSIQEISPFIQLCQKASIPVTVRCGGTGLRGAAVSSQEGVILLTGHLRKLIVNENTFVAEPGVTIRQLNQKIKNTSWEFPLPIATAGVAGLAGCLSTQAMSYDQQFLHVWDLIDEVTLINGKGEMQTKPAAWVRGAEGAFGVIIQLKGRLSQRPQTIQRGVCSISWQEIEEALPDLCFIQSLEVLSWQDNELTYQLEGDLWRIEIAKNKMKEFLKKKLDFNEISVREDVSFSGVQQPYFILGSLLSLSQFSLFKKWATEWAQDLNLQCSIRCNFLTNHLLCLIQGEHSIYDFKQAFHQFLVFWCNALVEHSGKLSHCQGIGLQLPGFTPPFWNEDQIHILKHLQQKADPSQLFSRNRLFPMQGKSLEKMRT